MDGKGDDSCVMYCEKHLLYSGKIGNPELRLATLLTNGDKWSYYTGTNGAKRLSRAENYYAFLLEEAKETHNQVYECKAYAHMANLVRYRPGEQRYVAYALSADSIAGLLKCDSLHVIALLSIAQCNLNGNDVIQCFRNTSAAADYADNLNDSTFRRQCYIQFTALYYKLKMIPEALNNVNMAFRIDSLKQHYNKFALLEDYGLKAMIHELVPKIGFQLARIDYSEWLDFCISRQIYPTWAQTIKLYTFSSFLKEKQFNSAIKYFKANKDLPLFLANFHQQYKMAWATANYELAQSNLTDAEQNIHMVIDSLKKKDELQLIEAQFDLFSILMKQKKYRPAMQQLDDIRSQANDMNILSSLAFAYQKLSLEFAAEHDYQLAYLTRNRGLGLKDTVDGFRNETHFNEQRLAQEKQHEESRKHKLDAEKDRNQRTLYLGGAFVVILLLGLCAWFVAYKMPPAIIRFSVVMSFVLTFELLSHLANEPLTGLTGDNPIIQFTANLAIGSVLGIIHENIQKKAIKKLGVSPVTPNA